MNSALPVLKCQPQKFQAPRLSAGEANPEAKHPCDPKPPDCKNTAFDLPKFTSQLHETTWLSCGHCDGKMPVIMGKGLCTQAGYEKKLASSSLSSETAPKPSGCYRSIHTAEIPRPFNPVPETHILSTYNSNTELYNSLLFEKTFKRCLLVVVQ